jgi:hypothetical protein
LRGEPAQNTTGTGAGRFALNPRSADTFFDPQITQIAQI